MQYMVFPIQDATIYEDVPTQNAGMDEILELSKTLSNGTVEVSRILMKFDLSPIETMIADDVITGDVQYILRLYTTEMWEFPATFTLNVEAVDGVWDRGLGRRYDNPISTSGVSWTFRQSGVSWTTPGGAWQDGATVTKMFAFEQTDFEVDVTSIVEAWIADTYPNEGFLIRRADADEAVRDQSLLKFFSRNTGTVYVPRLEVRWDDSAHDPVNLMPLPMTTPLYIRLGSMLPSYSVGSKVKCRVHARELHPPKTYGIVGQAAEIKYLPATTYYSIVDVNTGETVVPFSDYTKVSLDGSGHFFEFFSTAMMPERMYTVRFKVVSDDIAQFYDTRQMFKITK